MFDFFIFLQTNTPETNRRALSERNPVKRVPIDSYAFVAIRSKRVHAGWTLYGTSDVDSVEDVLFCLRNVAGHMKTTSSPRRRLFWIRVFAKTPPKPRNETRVSGV